jgi:hemoglobin
MEQDPQVQELLAIHPLPLDNVREKFYEFLSGWLGGPPLFANKYGHPRLRKRHAPFTVSPKLKTQWMFCMDKALTQCIDNPEVVAALHQAFDDLAEHMINSVEPICPSQQQQ